MSKNRVAIALAAETGADVRTVKYWLSGRQVSQLTAWALERAAVLMDLADEVDRIRGAQGAA